MGKKVFATSHYRTKKSIQDILKAITSGIAKGKITFSDEDEKIVMRPEGLLDLKVTATQEDNRNASISGSAGRWTIVGRKRRNRYL